MAATIRDEIEVIRVALVAKALRGIGCNDLPKGNALEGSRDALQRAEVYKISKLRSPIARTCKVYIVRVQTQIGTPMYLGLTTRHQSIQYTSHR